MLNAFKKFVAALHPARPRHARATVHCAARVEYECSIINPDGSVASRSNRRRNLILDQGLNLVATVAMTGLFQYCAVGTGTNPTKRDSGSITFTRAGTTITASSGFFVPADVGRLLKWDTGEEVYVSAYTDSTHVSSVASGTIGAAEGTIWYVNDTGLQTESARTGNILGGGANNGTSFSVDTYTHKRTFLFPAVGGAITYREIGWSNTASAGANLFGRDLIPGAGDSLLPGQQYQVVVRLFVTISPVTVQVQSDVGNNGFVTTGTYNHEYIGNAYSVVDSGGSTGNGGLEPNTGTKVTTKTGSFTLLTSPSFTNTFATDEGVVTMTNAAYTNGNFYRDSSGTIAVTDGNSTDVRAFVFGQPDSGVTWRNFSVRFDNPQTKDSLHTLTITLRKSWGRILVN